MTTQLTEIALQMLGTIERMELIIPEITDTIRKALEEKAALAEPEPPADAEVAELVAELRETAAKLDDDWYHASARIMRRAADLLSRLAPQPVPEGPTRRVYFDMPSQIAECGGPCLEGGPEACDCGALWKDEPVPEMPTDENIMKLMSPQMNEDFAFAARAMADTDNMRVRGVMRIMLNRHAVDLARSALVYWGRP